MRRVLLGLATAILLAAAFCGVIGWRTWHNVLSLLHPVRLAVPPPPAIEGLVSVEFKDSNGIALKGWWVPSKNRAAVIFCHGHANNRGQLVSELKLLTSHGYGVLTFDAPGHGESGGEIVTWGDRERASMAAAIDFVGAQPSVHPARIGALGFSMGSNTVVDTAATDTRLKAIAVAGTYSSLREEFLYKTAKWGPFSQIPAMWALEAEGVKTDEVSPIAVICKISPRPVLIISGTEDVLTPNDMEARLIATACEPKTVLMVKGAHHGDYETIDRVEYEDHLLKLFDGSLLK